MLGNLKKTVYRYAYFILPICTLLCLAGFIGSYLFPNEVLDTYEVNMKEEEGDAEFVQPLTGEEDEIGYLMETDGRALKGFQIGISKGGAVLEGTELVYRVYKLPEEEAKKGGTARAESSGDKEGTARAESSGDKGGTVQSEDMEEMPQMVQTEGLPLILEKSYDLGACLDGQYPYLPFDDEGLCKGRLYITFTYRANGSTEGLLPGIYANHKKIDNAGTYINGQRVFEEGIGQEAVMIKHYYIYSHDTYPLLYDCRVLTFVFLSASMTVCYPKLKKKVKEGGRGEG